MPPMSVLIKPVSGACNLRCRYCFYSDVMEHREQKIHPRMTLETLEKTVRRVMAYADDCVTFAFQGGEPTLIGLPFFKALMKYERMYNPRRIPVTNAVQTNGFDLPDELIDFFAREKFLLGVSLDGDRAAHDQMRLSPDGTGTFERVKRNLERLRAAGVEHNILCVVNEYVAQRADDVLDALWQYDYLQFIACLDGLDGVKNEWSLTEKSYLNFLLKAFDRYERSYRAGRPVSIRGFDNFVGILMGRPPENCAAGGRCAHQLVIEGDGSVYPCDFYVLDEWRSGSINETGVKGLIRSETAQRFTAQSLPVPAQCRACKWYPLCRNGCRREREPETGLYRWCGVMQSFFESTGERMLRMAQALAQQ